ncbi:oplophorus-luciferin 2-monooxygenase non-catalytic subunit-like [Uloborus diversus]|uniref:oplophorus-luciferin 2-monooxygenase non-catalytic subunit-like n=1 Tax=Uloborus diversus TaxID=327109 RepID=UPI002409C6DC|nr:oplophorus-luciferin 2-monooxygenase non-catalytic subunit-like [Uloborus diversus]
MGFYWFVIAAVIAGTVFGDDSCPSATELKPCTCDGEGVNCMLATSVDQIRTAFKANFKYGGVRSIWIQGTPITNVPADLFSGIRSQQFYIEVNNITSVDMDAFRSSNMSMISLSFFGNKLSTFPFGKLQEYKRLGSLNLGRNRFTSIPDNAFKSNSLGRLLLSQNGISHIGKNAFSGLPSLNELHLTYNQLTTLGPESFSWQTNAPSLQILLQANMISSVSKTAFQGTQPYGIQLGYNKLTSLQQDSFIEVVTKIVNKGGYLELNGNPLTCRGCDYTWLVLNKNTLQKTLPGFRCPDGTGLRDLTYSKIGCNP